MEWFLIRTLMVADIIDNSISAEANTVNCFFDPIAVIPYFCILDNGYGMNFTELNKRLNEIRAADKIKEFIEIKL